MAALRFRSGDAAHFAPGGANSSPWQSRRPKLAPPQGKSAPGQNCTHSNVPGGLLLIHTLPVYEAVLQSDRAYDNPPRDAWLRLEAEAPDGSRSTAEAFWDGGLTWRARLPVREAGPWRWRTVCSDRRNAGLHGREGNFEARPSPDPANLLHVHGALRLSADRRHFCHADGTPWFWMADTAWNGVLKARPDDWERYLTARRQQGFTAIQLVTTHWRAFPADRFGEQAFSGQEPIRINPRFFQRLDGRVAAINRHGLVAAPVLLWACTPTDPGHFLPEEDSLLLARYIVARYAAYQVIWILGGDGDYRGAQAERWRRIGQALFGERSPHRLVTMHPGGQHWVANEFREEPWIDFLSYQSGHGDGPEQVEWLVRGRAAEEWLKSRPWPVLNLEPNYEAHLAYQSRRPFDAHQVRRALYWSLLLAPTAGVTYGHHSIWPWMEERAEPPGHARSGIAEPWPHALNSEGAASVAHLVAFFQSLPWWRLQPDPSLLVRQPGDGDPQRHVAASRTEDGSSALLYLPAGGDLYLHLASLRLPVSLRWFNPRTGAWTEAGRAESALLQVAAPDAGDWLLLLEAA
jgi:hypothetical protein